MTRCIGVSQELALYKLRVTYLNYPEGEGCKLLRNLDTCIPINTVLYKRTLQYFWYSIWKKVKSG